MSKQSVYELFNELLPLTTVGSFPKPDYVKNPRGYLREDSRRATEENVREQERMGYALITDGEFATDDMVTKYVRHYGFPLAGWTQSYDNRFWRKGKVSGDFKDVGFLQLEPYTFTQGLTKLPVKGMLTGPTTLTNWDLTEYDGEGDVEDVRRDIIYKWAGVINKEARALQDAGARYIQVDEPAIGEWYWEDELFKEGLRRSFEGIDAYRITHVCYADFEKVYPRLKDLPVDMVDIELSTEFDKGLKNSPLLREVAKDPLTKYKAVALGFVDVRPGIPVETKEQVKRRIRTALEVFAQEEGQLEQIMSHPDCGFRTTKDIGVSYGKMQVLSDATKEIRAEIRK
jgi:5-methyltetrahydropteroyltriglutamate--homocysteine methyltransferase